MCELLVWCLFNRILDEVFGFLIKYVDLGGVDRQIDHLIRVVMRNAECLDDHAHAADLDGDQSLGAGRHRGVDMRFDVGRGLTRGVDGNLLRTNA